MKIYKNPWVSRESYFVKTGKAYTRKQEATASTGYCVQFWDGKWEVSKAQYYDCTLREMPIVAENKVSIQGVIDKAILNAVLGLVHQNEEEGVQGEISID